MRLLLIAAMLLSGLAIGRAAAAEQCAPGSYSVVMSPDSTTLSILFDSMVADSTAPDRVCSVHVPLSLPEGMSLGVYRVDYRGYAHLSSKDDGQFSATYRFGPNKARAFSRKIRGPADDDFTFTENIGAGLMKRVGCGSDASLEVTVGIALPASAPADDLASIDSADGAPKGGVVYHFDLKKCQP
ncbi:MAG: DUF4360 domain-containing protein [Devosia nanyangense]|uniref:DUF4360 domain-containing protein n=1 Tax=Devosia nanyangense TaxID=1228055 RepID=A0A933L540_9HYPH|nr:DUF4360 domain-containing protein [Devosia nanyangense]